MKSVTLIVHELTPNQIGLNGLLLNYLFDKCHNWTKETHSCWLWWHSFLQLSLCFRWAEQILFFARNGWNAGNLLISVAGGRTSTFIALKAVSANRFLEVYLNKRSIPGIEIICHNVGLSVCPGMCPNTLKDYGYDENFKICWKCQRTVWFWSLHT